MLRPDDLGKDIGSLCFRACLSILSLHPKGGGPGGARVVTSYAGMVPGYAGSLGYDGAPRFDWGIVMSRLPEAGPAYIWQLSRA